MIIPGKGETRLDRIVQAIGEMATGGSNALGRSDITLTPGEAETTVTDRLSTEGALILFSPLNASAAAAGVFLKSTGAAHSCSGTACPGRPIACCATRSGDPDAAPSRRAPEPR